MKLNIGNVLRLSPNPKTFFAVSANIGNVFFMCFPKFTLRYILRCIETFHF
jgi:hypothetical protein